jgi:hypothetical protein
LDKKQGGSVEVARGDLRRGDAREKFLRVVLAAFKWGCSGRHRGEEMEGGGGVRPRPMGDAPAGSGPEPLGVDGRRGSIARPAQDRGGHVAVVWAQPQCQGLNPLKPGQTDSNKFEFNLNPFKLILIQTRPLQA